MRLSGWPAGRRIWASAAAFAAVLAIGAAALFAGNPHLPSDSADGTYFHDCCGTLELRDGDLIANGAKWVSYIVERDEAGPYILPKRFVGTWEDRGFQLDGSRPPLKLRLDSLPNPSTIELSHLRGSYVFKRKAPRAR